jgi:uncharacterized protein YhhL (DUF1145 family)
MHVISKKMVFIVSIDIHVLSSFLERKQPESSSDVAVYFMGALKLLYY